MPFSIQSRKPWKTVRIGTFERPQQLREALIKSGCKLDTKFELALIKGALPMVALANVPVIRVKVRQLGFQRGTRSSEVLARVRSMGLGACPIELAPQLRLQYLRQPAHEFLWVVTEPVRLFGADYGYAVRAQDQYLGDDNWKTDRWLQLFSYHDFWLGPESDVVCALAH